MSRRSALVCAALLCGLLGSCAPLSRQKLAEQSAAKALTALNPAWPDSGPPHTGAIADLSELHQKLSSANEAQLSFWGMSPHDNSPNPKTQSLIESSRFYSVQLDTTDEEEEISLLETSSGELFVSVFAKAQDDNWAWVDSYRLPSLARKRSCRSSADGASLRGAQATRNAPVFLWMEVQLSDTCAERPATEKFLLMLSLQQGRLSVVFQAMLSREERSASGLHSGEQLALKAEVEARTNTIHLAGAKSMFPAAGGELLQKESIDHWYFFDGTRYQKQD